MCDSLRQIKCRVLSSIRLDYTGWGNLTINLVQYYSCCTYCITLIHQLAKDQAAVEMNCVCLSRIIKVNLS